MSQPTDPNTFLEHACLNYDGQDGPARREQAQAMLAEHPEWVEAHAQVAAATGSLKALDAHLQAQPGLIQERFGKHGWTLLHCVCLGRVLRPDTNALGCLRALLNAGADAALPYQIGPHVFRGLTGAIDHGEGGPKKLPPHPEAKELAVALLEAGAPANDPQALYNTMLSDGNHWLELLLAHGLVADDPIDWDMGTGKPVGSLDFVLAHAANSGRIERMRILLAHGADPHANNPYDGRTIATSTLLQGQTEALEILAEHEAVPGELTLAERYRVACMTEDTAQVRQIHQSAENLEVDQDLLPDLLGSKKYDSAQLVLELGADPSLPNKHGATALHYAAFHGDIRAVQMLLRAGADAERVDRNYGTSPRRWALHNGQQEAADLLP